MLRETINRKTAKNNSPTPGFIFPLNKFHMEPRIKILVIRLKK